LNRSSGTFFDLDVLHVNHDGTVDLTCKRHVSLHNVLFVGQKIKYYSDTKGEWRDTEVLYFNYDGTVDVTHHKNCPFTKIKVY